MDLHFVVRDRLAEILRSPEANTLRAAHAAVDEFLSSERQLVLFGPEQLHALGIELSDLLESRRAVRRALSRLEWSDSGTSAVIRVAEALRLVFLDHAAHYGQPHRTAGRDHRAPIPLPANTTS